VEFSVLFHERSSNSVCFSVDVLVLGTSDVLHGLEIHYLFSGICAFSVQLKHLSLKYELYEVLIVSVGLYFVFTCS
jgi:hypothetical protein